MKTASRFLSIAAAARRVDRDESTIRRWIDRGLMFSGGLIPEGELLEFEKKMRASRGRPRRLSDAEAVAADVAAERARQDAKWGEQNHMDGTGPVSMPLYSSTATGIADDDDATYIRDVMTGRTEWRFSGDGDRPGTWADILLEEVFEALAEAEPQRLYDELIQVAAVAQQWAEAIKRRSS